MKEKEDKKVLEEERKEERKRKPIKNILSTHGRDISFVVLLIISFAILVNIFVLALRYSAGTEDQAILMARNYSEDATDHFHNKIDSLREKTNALAAGINFYSEDDNDLSYYLNSIIRSDGYKEEGIQEIWYYIGDKTYNYRGAEISSVGDRRYEYILDMKQKNVLATRGFFYDDRGEAPCVICYCPTPEPLSGEKKIDGIAVFYPLTTIMSFAQDLDESKKSYSEFQALCCETEASDNNLTRVLGILNDKSGKMQENDAFGKYLESINNGRVFEEKLKSMLETGKSETATVSVQNELYVVSVGRANETDTGLCVISLYKASDVYGEGYELVTTIITTMVILIIVVLVFALIFMISRRKLGKRIEEINMVNAALDCPTLLKYKKDASDILARNTATDFAVVISHVHHFSYITEKFGETASLELLKHLKETFSRALLLEECYGYMVDGDFIMLLHYKDKDKLENRLVGLFSLAKKITKQTTANYDLKISYGIYETTAQFRSENPSENIDRMIDKAIVVRDIPSRSDVNQICHFYNENVRTDYLQRAEIEGRMEGALASGEFRVFYQPKYNLVKDYIDGAELLVRWYDPAIKKYRSPGEFLPVFEANGFISKLDRHIYYTACETLATRVAEGKKVFPISVNVSRITAIQPDFLEYYIRVKNKFRIADKFVTLEFTESFAYENYEYLSTVAKELRRAGFLCSIDDFGTGYSSYNILKILDMDEIKLDKFFLDKGASEERDRIILESVIDVAKKMRVKVTQEGVETRDDLDRLRGMGCEVIQGYYFAKPMSANDYDAFIDAFLVRNKILYPEG